MCDFDHRMFLASSQNFLFEDPAPKLQKLWHSIESGPYAKASDKACDYFTLIETCEESTTCELDGNHAHKIRESHFQLMMKNIRK